LFTPSAEIEDHIHMLLQFPATIVIADAIRDIKSNSSGWMSGEIGSLAWQQGYGGFGVSKSNIAAVVRYIQSGTVPPQNGILKRSSLLC
jgi:putative transposase